MQRPNTLKVLLEVFRKWNAKRIRHKEKRMFSQGYNYAMSSLDALRSYVEQQKQCDHLSKEAQRFRGTRYDQYAQGIASAIWDWSMYRPCGVY